MRIFILSIFLLAVLSAPAQTNNILRGNEFYAAGQFEQAELNYKKAVESDPENTTALFNLVNALCMQTKFDEAIRYSTQLTKIAKDSALRSAAYYNQGVAHTKLNHLDASIESYKNSLKYNPADPDARFNLQKALLQQKQKKQSQSKDQQKQSSSMSQKQADQKLKQLQQKERDLQQKKNQKNSEGGGGAEDW